MALDEESPSSPLENPFVRGVSDHSAFRPSLEEEYESYRLFVRAMSLTKEVDISHLTVFFVFGGPGAGKGTLCSRICQELGYAHVCPGDLLRAAMQENNEELPDCEKALLAMKEGALVPITTIKAILSKALREVESPVVLLDGFPRDLEQMGLFEQFFGEAEYGLLFSCNEETMARRVHKRSQQSNRVDDTMETTSIRFRHFEEETMTCVNIMRHLNELVELDCSGDLDEIYDGIKSQIQKLVAKPKKNRGFDAS